MKVALIGISGRVGSRLATELLRRGHQVTGIARNPDGVALRADLTIRRGDANETSSLVPLISGHDALISAGKLLSIDVRRILAAVSQAEVPRLLVVGGAGSLDVAPGVRLLDSPDFPEAYREESTAGAVVLDILREEKTVDWTFLSPSALLVPGERTGVFRIGGDQLLVDARGKSWISMEDYAIALVDELETPKHSRKRFTVGY
jgi:putative NADH-flavin reductase